MKSTGKKIFLTVALAIALCLLMGALPATVYAVGYLQLGSEIGSVGERIDITGYGFDKNRLIAIYLSPIDAEIEEDYIRDIDVFQKVLSRTTDANGRFSSYFIVPERLMDGEEEEDVKSGIYYIYLTEARIGKIKAKVGLAIAGLSRVRPSEGPAGTEVSIRGDGFEKNEDITVYFDDESVPIVGGDTNTDIRGDFECTIEVPEGIVGEHILAVADDSGHRGQTEFTVQPGLVLTPSPASKLDKVTIRGTGFSKRSYIDIYFDGDEQILAGKFTDDRGSFNTSLSLLPDIPGDYSVRVEDEDKNEAEAVLTIVAGIRISPDTGNVGTPVTVTGTGFKTKTAIAITYDNDQAPATTTTTDSYGKFEVTFTVPASQSGLHSITATDGTSTSNTSFVMESDNPAVPVPVAPETNARAPSRAVFDWEDVDDPSGVVYNLEIAISREFTPGTMALQKTGLTESEYALTEAEQLKPTQKNEPYYWRVKAIDGASNESEWSEPEPFAVGATFNIMDWLPYILMAIGGLLVIFIIFWLKGRMA
ncbi:MAG TPA: hypothetical protein G4O09_04795 [Dehalococcoidia bacterium]|nr:hypothetical protein [Dehalococcoidia bacterium]